MREHYILKAAWLGSQLPSESVLQNFELSLVDLAAASPAFDPATLVEVRLVFDRTPVGVVALDDLGFH